MERGSVLKWILFGIAAILLWQVGIPLLFGSKEDHQALGASDWSAPAERAPEKICTLQGDRFSADLSTRGGSLRSVRLAPEKYKTSLVDTGILSKPVSKDIDLVTTSREERMPLRTNLRAREGAQQVPYDDLDWELTASDGSSCTFVYTDESSRMTKVVSATGHPYELDVKLTVENLAPEKRKHRLAVEQTAWRTSKEVEGHLGTVSEFMTDAVVATTDGETHRYGPGDFEPGDFKDKEFTAEGWRRPGHGDGVPDAGRARFVATTSSYFANALVPVEGPVSPYGEAQIEEIYTEAYKSAKTKDPQHGHVYRTRLAYPEQELEPNGKVTYHFLSFTGPKERDVLAGVGGGRHSIVDAIDMGWFGAIGKILVSYVYTLYRLVGSWGWAIVLLTITVKILLFPLSIAQIKSSVAMRRLKPEMDAINAKYKDDAAQRGLAIQELWRKNKVANPVTGCIPLLLQMPIWWSLYQALRTAVELYHTPFGPFIPDLSAPGKYFIIPLVLGASSFIQQKLMPPQGDPQQQKMMLYMMPAIFTFMMLFLPAGLGVYMLTNTWLGIVQQVAVERYLQAKTGGAGEIEVRDKTPSEKSGTKTKGGSDGDSRSALPAHDLGKGKARARG